MVYKLGNRVLDCEEHYITKTCSLCGCLTNIYKEKIYKCEHCNTTYNRDYNAMQL